MSYQSSESDIESFGDVSSDGGGEYNDVPVIIDAAQGDGNGNMTDQGERGQGQIDLSGYIEASINRKDSEPKVRRSGYKRLSATMFSSENAKA